ncbi:MAG: DUF3102 domain-containing protein [Saprospiraceae bacterium]|nr:DUF3102 domain-containing protein [Saprospiraceae bacterium]
MEITEILSQIIEVEREECLLEANRLEIAFKKGKLLIELKNAVPHGEFSKKLKEYGCNTSIRTAQRQMQLAENEEFIRSNTTDLSQLSVDKALQMIKKEKKSTEKKEDVPFFNVQFRKRFNSQTQNYYIIAEIPADKIAYMSNRKNALKMANDIIRLSREIKEYPALSDISYHSLN